MAKRRRPKGGRITPKGVRPSGRHHSSAAMPSPIELLLCDAGSVARDHDDINETEGWASAIQSAFRTSGFPPRPGVSPRLALREARGEGGTGGAVLAAAMAVYGPEPARARAAKVAADDPRTFLTEVDPADARATNGTGTFRWCSVNGCGSQPRNGNCRLEHSDHARHHCRWHRVDKRSCRAGLARPVQHPPPQRAPLTDDLGAFRPMRRSRTTRGCRRCRHDV